MTEEAAKQTADQNKPESNHHRELQLVTVPAPVLREVCSEVQSFDKQLRRFVKNMKEIMRTNDGIGLAASQVGVKQRVFTAELEDEFLCLINPEITRLSFDSQDLVEGCLSLPTYGVRISRPREITVKGYDPKGKPKELHLSGLWAKVVQHEIDHLNGILITDRGTPEEQTEGTE